MGALVGRVVEESELVPRDRLIVELEPVRQPVDAAKVERIVENLLANAARHAPAHGHRLGPGPGRTPAGS